MIPYKNPFVRNPLLIKFEFFDLFIANFFIRKIENENLLNPSISLMGRILDWIVLRIFKQKDKWLAVALQPMAGKARL